MSSTALFIDAARCGSSQRVFGLTTLERLRRSVTQELHEQVPVILSGGEPASAWRGAVRDDLRAPLGQRLRQSLQQGAALLVLDGAAVIDPRLLRFLQASTGSLVARRGEGAATVVALRLQPECAAHVDPAATDAAQVAAGLLAGGHAALVDESRFPAYVDKLRRVVPYWLFRVDDAATRNAVERRLFLDNYKGSTDLLTAYVYPPLVWPLVRLCARLRIHPNAVTALSVVLAIAAVPLFAQAEWLAGFACAYVMSVLDSVDGKLARLTLTDSQLGNVMDHGLDLLHPPFWYWAWAEGLVRQGGASELTTLAALLNMVYVLDRFVLGVARRRLGRALHVSSPLDEKVRGFIARRNITMTLIALALLVGAGPAGFVLVALWQGATLLWHAWRTLWHGWLAPPRTS
jgi:phosphatidylglycerophosphate synthase